MLNESSPPQTPAPTSMGRVRAKLHELFGVDLRSLALLRIGLGVAVMADVAMRAIDTVGLYSDGGVLPRDLLLDMEGRGVYLSAHYWASAHPLLQGALFGATLLCAVALLLGWRTRLATFACWYLVSSVQIRQPLGYMGGDSILRMLLFWALFLPLGARFSRDAADGRMRAQPDRFISGATIALLLQVCIIYWATGIRKTGPLWASGEAIFYALHAHEWVTPVGIWLRQFPALLQPMTYATLGLEMFGPFLAFVPIYSASFRVATILAFWGFHLGLATTMNIGLFPLFSMVAWLPFLPTQAWTWIGAATTTAPQPPRDWRSRLASVAALVVLTYVLVLVAERARIIPRVVPRALASIGTALRIQQSWAMFAPDPGTVTRQYEIRKTLSDGTVRTEVATHSFRWTVYLARVGTPSASDTSEAQSLLRYAYYRCAEHDAGTGPLRVERIAIVMHQFDIGGDGLSAARRQTLLEVPCPAQ